VTEGAHEDGGEDCRPEQSAGPEESATPSAEYMELYKLAVEMTDRMSARRVSTNAFFVTVNTALLSFLGVAELETVWPVAVAGIIVSFTWALLIRSYRKLNAAKFTVINSAEQQLPLRIYSDEWHIVKPKHSKGWRDLPKCPKSWSDLPKDLKSWRDFLWQYLEFTIVETLVPVVFLLLYLAVLFF
jgi:hypothetical protein